jgi:drug/metabolite transporter (DMT)-like permease
MQRDHLSWRPILILLLLSALWGANYGAIRIGSQGLAPLFMASFRSLVAALCLFVWMRFKRIPIFPDRSTLWHGVVVGLLFGSEFGCIYVGLNYTLASRSYVFVYTQPFFVALGAHFFIAGDRLDAWKTGGLALAFGGVIILFAKDWGTTTFDTLPGDLLLLCAGALWASTTLYVKRFLTKKTRPVQTLFYQLLFSMPLLLFFSLTLEDHLWFDSSFAVGVALIYQCVVVAFVSYLVWFNLIHRYPVSLLTAFTFFTPVFGVLISGVVLLGEGIKPVLVLSLILVSFGMILVNRPALLHRQG